MVQDNSVDFEETWTFLDNRMKETQTFGHNFQQVGECTLTLHVLNTRWLYVHVCGLGFAFSFKECSGEESRCSLPVLPW